MLPSSRASLPGGDGCLCTFQHPPGAEARSFIASQDFRIFTTDVQAVDPRDPFRPFLRFLRSRGRVLQLLFRPLLRCRIWVSPHGGDSVRRVFAGQGSDCARCQVWDTSSASPHGRTALCCHHGRLDLRERPGPFPFLGRWSRYTRTPCGWAACRRRSRASRRSRPPVPAALLLRSPGVRTFLKERQARCSCIRDLISWRILQKRPLRPLLPGDLAAIDPDIQPGRDGRH